ncbi:MAG: binding-protein-dependent transport system inner rane component [Chloroflexi bacterium]|nr:binding-protein-dependent transport system inner rane component [Chloroflexota bacterium]
MASEIQTDMSSNEAIDALPQRAFIWRRLPLIWRHSSLLIGGIILIILIILTVGAPIFTSSDPTAQDPNSPFLAPAAGHVMGTDALGRSLFARVLYGGRWTIAGSIAAITIATLVGTLIGLVAGYVGGLIDAAIMRGIDLLLAFPGILFALALATITGPGLTGMTIAIGVSLIPGTARIVRGLALQGRSLGYIEAAHSLGGSSWHIIWRHLLPNLLPQVVVLATTGLGIASLSVATLGFLGLGLQPPTPEWGAIINDGREYVTIAWWITFFPGMAMSLYVIAVNLVGDGLREILDPTLSIGLK